MASQEQDATVPAARPDDAAQAPEPDSAEQRHVETGELVDEAAETDEARQARESIEQPAKVMRVGAMMRQLLEELRNVSLDEPSRERLADIFDTSIAELQSALSPDLHNELTRLSLPFSDEETPTEAELVVARAQLVGWLEGLVQGIQATLFAQQMAAQQQLANMRQQLPPGAQGQQRPGPSGPPPGGTYL